VAEVTLTNLNKFYGQTHAVKDFNLTVADQEFVVLVGPSGCGKSTTLRMVAGLEDLGSGTIVIGSRVVNDLPPRDRDIAMVFQNYALYQHMTVYDNLAFGLRNRKVPAAKIDEEIDRATNILGITDLLKRKPRQLSGGQQQRVALGRCIVRHPRVFLFDEPLSNLDAKLRAQMRVELKHLRKRVATTSIYVTHDQVEAMTLGDRVVVMHDGYVLQVGTPLEIYNEPRNLFVAGFIGSPAMNFVGVKVVNHGDALYAECDGLRVRVPEPRRAHLSRYTDREVTLGVRPEHIALGNPSPEQGTTIDAVVALTEQLGSEQLLDAQVGPTTIVASRIDPRTSLRHGETVRLTLNPNGLHFFDNDSEEAIV